MEISQKMPFELKNKIFSFLIIVSELLIFNVIILDSSYFSSFKRARRHSGRRHQMDKTLNNRLEFVKTTNATLHLAKTGKHLSVTK